MNRWQQSSGSCRGLKLHFGNSDVDLLKPEHLKRLKPVFQNANRNKLSLLVHIRPLVNRKRSWGAEQARSFLKNILPSAPEITIQIAHMAGADSYDDSIDGALEGFAGAITTGDKRAGNLLFDISGVWANNWGDRRDQVVTRIRQIGLNRILFGSDEVVPTALKQFHTLGLTTSEFRTIEQNQAAYWLK